MCPAGWRGFSFAMRRGADRRWQLALPAPRAAGRSCPVSENFLRECGMSERVNIRISVRNLVEFLLREGDIDNRRGGMAEKEAMLEGGRIHRKIQGEMGGDYQAEVPLSADVCWEECTLTVEGRADGIFSEDGVVYIDEIKGMYRDVLGFQEPLPLHLAQAKCYASIYAAQQGRPAVGIQMTYCNLETEEVKRIRQTFPAEELASWFEDLTGQYRRWAKLQIDWQEIRRRSIQALAFPYDWRPGQREVSASVYRTIVHGRKLFIQAPTGTGKTLSTLFPAVKALGEGLADRIFYATAKTVTRTVAEEAFEILRRGGLHLKTVTLTAREKICFLRREAAERFPADAEDVRDGFRQERSGEIACNPEVCPYAKGHFDRVNEAVYELVAQKEEFSRTVIEAQAQKWRVCPFEMGMDISMWADGIVCDYSYLFDPRAKLKRFFGGDAKGEYLFLIDEAHNLVERGREMFSASLYKEDFLALRTQIRPYSRRVSRALTRCNSWLLEQKKDCGEVRLLKSGSETDGLGVFPVYLMNLCGAMEEFLEESGNTELNEKVLDLYFQVRRFLETCDRLNENYVIYTEQCADRRFLLRLFCVDISENLQECLDRGKSTIYFSATFLPIRYYRALLSTRTDDYAIYAEPVFDPSNRLVLIGADISSRYANRNEREYRRMAAYILEAMRARRGNYLVFFSSYRMLDDVAGQFEALCQEQGEEIELICQRTGMQEQEREEFLAQFEKTHPQGLAGFCVMGGIFGEGIDLRADRLIGAIVVGTGIPQICHERELLKDFYDRRGEDGFFYAYLCPGMNRVLQSAGRVIRTESDRGMILLLDERFAAARYRSMFPAEWQTPALCSLNNVREKIEAFWNSGIE